jgi:hypothetical protein
MNLLFSFLVVLLVASAGFAGGFIAGAFWAALGMIKHRESTGDFNNHRDAKLRAANDLD